MSNTLTSTLTSQNDSHCTCGPNCRCGEACRCNTNHRCTDDCTCAG